MEATRRSANVPRTQEIAAGLVEAVQDSESSVRRNCATSLSMLYSPFEPAGSTGTPLPQATDRFVEQLAEALDASDIEVRSSVYYVYQATARRLARPAP